MSAEVEKVEANWTWLRGYVESTLKFHKNNPSEVTRTSIALLGNVLDVARRVLNK